MRLRQGSQPPFDSFPRLLYAVSFRPLGDTAFTRDTGRVPKSISSDNAESVRHDACRAIPSPRQSPQRTSCEQAFLSNLRPTIIRKLKSAFTLLMASQCLTFRVGGVHTKRKFKYGKELSPRGLECECTQEERSTSITKQLVFQYPFCRKTSCNRVLERFLLVE